MEKTKKTTIHKQQINTMFRNLIIALVITCISNTQSYAQRIEIGAFAGAMHYFGDLNPNFGLSRPHAALGGFVRYNFNPRFSGRVGAMWGQISATDSDSNTPFQQARNLNFQTDIIDGTAQLEFNFLPYIHGSKDETVSPYLFMGGGFFMFNPKTEYNGKVYELASLGTEGQYIGSEYSLIQPQLSYGMGIKWDLSREWSMNFEFAGKKLFTDYLDDVSGNYTDEANLRSLRGNIAVALADRSGTGIDTKIGQPARQRGDGVSEDTYLTCSLSLVYNFNNVRCPTRW